MGRSLRAKESSLSALPCLVALSDEDRKQPRELEALGKSSLEREKREKGREKSGKKTEQRSGAELDDVFDFFSSVSSPTSYSLRSALALDCFLPPLCLL